MKNMKLNLLCWLSKSAAREEQWDLLPSKCRGAPGVTHSTEDAGVIEHTLCCSRVLLNVACSSSDTRLKPWVLCSLMWKSVLQVLEVTQFTWPLESETGKCQFRSAHGGAVYLQVLSPGLWLALGLSVFFSSYTYTHTHIGRIMNSSSVLLLPEMLCLGNYCP